MKELMKTKRLSISVVGYLAIILIGFLSIGKSDIRYTETRQTILNEIEAASYLISPAEIRKMEVENNNAWLLVDLREEYDYIKNHLNGAVNIPMNMVLDKAKLGILEDAKTKKQTVILYGKTLLDANGPWMILRMLGYSNLKVLSGGFSAMENAAITEKNHESSIENPIADFKNIIKTAQEMAKEPEVKPIEKPAQVIVPVKKVEEEIDEGGC